MSTAPNSTAFPSAVYHYTSQLGLLGILQDKKLWLSSARHLNDSAEVNYAIEMLSQQLALRPKPEGVADEMWKKFSDDVSSYMPSVEGADHFVGSFSQRKDLLSQWRAYSGEGVGFSIGFNYERLKNLAVRKKCSLSRCSYKPADNTDSINHSINLGVQRLQEGLPEDAVSRCVVALLIMAPRLKHPSFEEEEEWRLISGVGNDDNSEVRFRVGKSMIIPYKEFDLVGEDGKTPITEVVVGPAPHMELSVVSVESLLLKSGIESVEVSLSDVPYRNW
jgi:hypothetical protein